MKNKKTKISIENFSIIDRIENDTQNGNLQYVDRSFENVDRLREILSDKNSKTKLAKALNKHVPEISKWLNGSHNFTIKTLSKIESVLGESIIIPVNGEEYNNISKKNIDDNYNIHTIPHSTKLGPIMRGYILQGSISSETKITHKVGNWIVNGVSEPKPNYNIENLGISKVGLSKIKKK